MIQWYVIRATGVVTLLLFSSTTVLGLLNRSRVTSDGWPRFVIDRLHRNLSLLSVTFLAIHIVMAATDSFVAINFVNAFVPFSHSYNTVWVGLGAVACDLLLALIITSLVRVRLGVTAWRWVHWLAYVAWPVAVAHSIGNGTDASEAWMLAIDVLCIGAVLAALAVRVAAPSQVIEEAW
jgi:methionine sulfoxide reductase heme-binding subunit